MSHTMNKRGFTLLEVLLAIVLVGTAWVIFAVNMESLLDKDPLAELESSFVLAQTEGRMMAFEDRESIELTWDEKARRFVLLRSEVVATYEVDGFEDVDEGPDMEVSFFFQQPRYKGESFENPDWFVAESVILYPDATSAAFKVQLVAGDRERELVVEPFTGFFSERNG